MPDTDTTLHGLVGITETNTHRFVALCRCGWASKAFHAVVGRTESGRPKYDNDKAQRNARAAHASHSRHA